MTQHRNELAILNTHLIRQFKAFIVEELGNEIGTSCSVNNLVKNPINYIGRQGLSKRSGTQFPGPLKFWRPQNITI